MCPWAPTVPADCSSTFCQAGRARTHQHRTPLPRQSRARRQSAGCCTHRRCPYQLSSPPWVCYTHRINLHVSIHNKANTCYPKTWCCFTYHTVINPWLSISLQICQENNIIQLFAITQKESYDESIVFSTQLQKSHFYFFIRKPALSVHWPSTKVLQISPKFP